MEGLYDAISDNMDHRIGAFLIVRLIWRSRSIVTLVNSSSGHGNPLYITSVDTISTNNSETLENPSTVFWISWRMNGVVKEYIFSVIQFRFLNKFHK